MAVTNEQINAWLAANPGATDSGIASAMNQFGVSTDQMAQATGLGQDAVQSRYDKAVAFRPLNAGEGQIPYMSEYIGNNPFATAQNISSVASNFGGTYDPTTKWVSTNMGGFNFGPPAVAPQPEVEQQSSSPRRGLRFNQPDNDALYRATQKIYDDRRAAYAGIAGNSAQPISYEQFNQQNPIEDNFEYQLIQRGIPGSMAATKDQLKEVYTSMYGAEKANALDAAGGFDLNKYGTSLPLYQYLNNSSSPEDISESYDQFISRAGGDTAANQSQAIDYLNNLGVSGSQINDAYALSGAGKKAKSEEAEIQQAPSVDAQEMYRRFGITDAAAAPTPEGILSGFKYAKDAGISEASMKKALGTDVYNTYQKGFADYAKTGIANILADKKLSFDEAREAVKFGRDYGYDSQKLADLTGADKKVFDAINKTYDDTTNKVVDSVLGAEDVKTDADKIGRALALQQKFGFTDEDLAKATDLSVNEVKGYLDPARNYEADYKKLLEDPNRSDDQIKAFLTASLQNPLLKEKLGDKLQPALNELNRPPRERILSQIEQQRNALGGQYYQGVFADPQVMAKILADKGVKSLADLGQKEKFKTSTAEAQYSLPNGRAATKFDDGTYGFIDDTGYDNRIVRISPDEMQTTYGRYVTDGNGETIFTPLKGEELATLKDGNFQERLGTVVVNKKTGEELTDTTHELAYQSSSGGANKKKNYLNVNFTKDGTPVLTASSERAGTGAALRDIAPFAAMVLPFVLPGIGAALSAMLPGAAVAASGAAAAIPATLMNQALTQGIISGGIGALGGQDVGKSFLSGAISPVISSGIGSILPSGLSENATRAITGAGTGVIKGALQGGDFEDLLGQGVLSGLTNYGLGETTKGLNLTPQQLNFATGIALPLAQGQKVNPIKLATTLAGAAR